MLTFDARYTSDGGPISRSDRGRRWEWVGTLAVLLVAGGLRLWRLDRDGYGNLYYAAAVRSMLASPSNFFFGSFDPVGLVTVDKPPVAIWLQGLAAALFGFRGLSLLVPQALLGVASVVLTYHLVRRDFGLGAGLLAGLFLAITPICVAVDRDNLPDPALVFVLLLAAWSLTLAAETGRLRPLLLATALVGVGFNVKMLASFVVLPTFYLCYLAAAPVGWWTRIGRLAAATLVLVAVSLSWSVAVELTPKDRRPYIGGSRTNSALELAMGYNGIGRVLGGGGNFGPPGFRPSAGQRPSPRPDADPSPSTTDEPAESFPFGGPPPGFPAGGPPGPGGPFPGGMPPMFGGTPGLLRFAQPTMAGQITWLVPIAVVGSIVAAARGGRHRPPSPSQVALLLWAGWLGTHWAVFSFARGIFHEYYTTIMGPAVASLAGIGVVALVDEWRRGGGRGYLPMALVLTAAWQASIVGRYPEIGRWLLPALGVGTVAGVLGLVASTWLATRRASVPWVEIASGVGLGAILIAPACWSLTPVVARGNAIMPAADPSAMTGRRDGGGMPPMPPIGMGEEGVEKLVAFLRANRHGERIIMAAPSSMEAASIIIETGEPAVSLGGFMGADPVLTADEFARMVADGEVRFVMIGGGPGGGMPGPPGGPGGPGRSEVTAWVREHGKVVDAKLWQAKEPPEDREPGVGGPGSPPGGFMNMFRRMRRMARLYDCRPELGLVAE